MSLDGYCLKANKYATTCLQIFFELHFGVIFSQEFLGQNVYGILRASKTASTEAIVLSVPYRLPKAPGGDTINGIALMMALAKSFRSQFL